MAITKHVYQIFIKATPEQVWDAIIEPSWTRRYFHGTAFDSPPVNGEPYRTSLADGRPAVDGTIEELDPPKRLVMTWHVLYDAAMSEEPPSRVEWILEPVGDGLTRLRLEHGDLARSPLTWANVKDGWVYVLDGLKTVHRDRRVAAAAHRRVGTDRRCRRRVAPRPGHRVQQLDVGDDRSRAHAGERRGDVARGPTRRPTTGHARRRRGPANDARERGCWPRCSCSSVSRNCRSATPTGACRSARSTASPISIWPTPTRPGPAL